MQGGDIYFGVGPEAPLRWTCKSVRNLTAELKQQGHSVSHQVVTDLLHELGYSLQANRKTTEGTNHPDRNAQFEHVNTRVKLLPRKTRPKSVTLFLDNP